MFGSKTSKQYQGFLKGLQEKYGAVTEDETKERNNEADGGEGVTIDDVKEVLAKHTDAGIIVFYSFIPADYDKLDTKAVFFLSDTGSADPKKIKKDIEGGKILGVIIGKQNTGLKPSDPVEKDPAKAFEKRYVLVEKSNLKANDKLF